MSRGNYEKAVDIPTSDEVEEALFQQVREGLMDCRWDGDTPTFRLTQKGEAAARSLIEELASRIDGE
jgi:hypothetical protein